MLRSGYSSDAVLRQVSTQRIVDRLDSETEKQLTQAGASTALVAALRDGRFQASPAEVAALEQKRSVQKTAASAPATFAPAVAQSSNQTSVSAPATTPPPDQVCRVLKNDLVVRENGTFVPYDEQKLLLKKFFLFFFSANGSPSGRKFTSRLIEYYDRATAQHPEVEVVFFSADRSQFGMETYMNASKMPWPAVDYPKISAQVAVMPPDFVKTIPSLFLLDSTGKLLSRTGDQLNAADLEKVLGDLDKILEAPAGALSITP